MYERCTQHVSSNLPTVNGDISCTSASHKLDGGRNLSVTRSTAALQMRAQTASVAARRSPAHPVSKYRDAPHSASSPSQASGSAVRARVEDSTEILARLRRRYEPQFRQTDELARADELTFSERVSAAAIDTSGEPATAELYTYDPIKGYQTPFGKVGSTPEKIPLPQRVKETHRQSGSVLIRKGKDFYHADGEHLYSVP